MAPDNSKAGGRGSRLITEDIFENLFSRSLDTTARFPLATAVNGESLEGQGSGFRFGARQAEVKREYSVEHQKIE